MLPREDIRKGPPLEAALPWCDEKSQLVTANGVLRWPGGKVYCTWKPMEVLSRGMEQPRHCPTSAFLVGRLTDVLAKGYKPWPELGLKPRPESGALI